MGILSYKLVTLEWVWLEDVLSLEYRLLDTVESGQWIDMFCLDKWN